MLEIHSESQAEIRQAGAAILDALELKEEDRTKPTIASSQIIRRVDDHQTQLINRMRHGNMILAGQTLYIMEAGAGRICGARRERSRKGRRISTFWKSARSAASAAVYLGGEERDIDVGYQAADRRDRRRYR